MKEKLQKLMAEYGLIALAVYLTTFVVTMTGFSIAIMQGFEVEGHSSAAGVLGAAWIATPAGRIAPVCAPGLPARWSPPPHNSSHSTLPMPPPAPRRCPPSALSARPPAVAYATPSG